MKVILGLIFIIALFASASLVFSTDDLASKVIEKCHSGIDKIKSIDFDMDDKDVPHMNLRRGGISHGGFPIDEDDFQIPSSQILYYFYY